MDLSYTIKTSAELQGAEAAADALERQIGKAKALKQDYSELQKQLDTMRGSIEEAKTEMAKSADVTDDLSGKTEKASGFFSGFSLKGREVREIVGELNRIIPGLGIALRGVGEVALESGHEVAAAEGEVAAASESMIASAGPLIVIVLAIQAAMEYWDLYKDKVAEAAEAQAKSLDKIRTDLRDAVEDITAFKNTLAEGMGPKDEEADNLARSRAIEAAKFKSKKDILKQDEQDELSSASTPEERAAIKSKYTGAETGLDSQHEQTDQQLLIMTIGHLAAKLDDLTQRGEDVESQIRASSNNPASLPPLNAELKEITEQIKKTKEDLGKYSGEEQTGGAVHAINDDERLRASNRTISRGVESIDQMAQTGHATPDMKEANLSLTQLFAQYSGGVAEMVAIVKNHIATSSTQDQEIQALKNALAGLRQQMAQHANAIDNR